MRHDQTPRATFHVDGSVAPVEPSPSTPVDTDLAGRMERVRQFRALMAELASLPDDHPDIEFRMPTRDERNER